MSSSNNAYDFFKKYMEQENEERKLREEENQIRYASRRAEKIAYRRRIEEAAGKICDMVIVEAAKGPENRKPEEIAALAAALNHATVAMNAAENYAESRPYYSVGFALGGG